MMDKKTLIGLVLIFAVFIGYGIWSSPSEQERAQMQRKQDSIASVKEKEMKAIASAKKNTEGANQESQDLNLLALKAKDNDSLKTVLSELTSNEFGVFSNVAVGNEKDITISNKLIDVKLSNLGAMVQQVTLKEYTTYGQTPVVLFSKGGNHYGLNLSVGSKVVRTEDLYFEPYVNGKLLESLNPIIVKDNDSVVISFRAYENVKHDTLSKTSDRGYIEFTYVVRDNDYRVGYKVCFNNLKNVITDRNSIEMVWNTDLRVQEKDAKVERTNSSIYYLLKDEVDYLKENGTDDKKDENGIPIKWISYKQQFFSCALIANTDEFISSQMQTITESRKSDSTYLRTMKSTLTIPFNAEENKSEFSMDFFYGPNKYNVISDYDLKMEQIIPLGWGFFLLQWINRFVIIPVFDFLSQFDWNMGIVILILTILVKIVLFPLAYKSFSSSAKMKVLQPEMQKINEKYPKQEQALEKQKSMMNLYKRAGINPMAGCLPMLLQFPILVAMFRFFPASIELRQQSFLWADDLSSYDSILNLPFSIPFYGSHVSLFCLLMTVAQLFYTKMTMKQQAATQQMPGMKIMMYMMPVMMLFMLNSFSAALNYYYFISMCFTFLQVWLIKMTINEDKVLAKLKENSNKPIKKSKWQERIEALEKQNKAILEQRQRQQQKRE